MSKSDKKIDPAEYQKRLDRMTEMLRDWNEFQDVIIQTRSVLEKQREVQVRTRDTLRGDGVKGRGR